MKILIVRFSSLGDIILTSFVIRCLRKKFPEAQIDFAVRERFSDLILNNPLVNNILALKEPAGFRQLFELSSRIEAEGYEYIIDLQRNFRSYFICSRSSAKIFRWHKTRFKRWLLIHTKMNFLHDAPAIPLRYLAALKGLGVEDDGSGLEFQVETSASESVRNLFFHHDKFDGTYAVIAPGAKWFTKQWGAENYSRLVKELVPEHCDKIILLGSRDERELCGFIGGDNSEMVLDLCGKTDFHEAAAVLKECRFYIGNDSGLSHLAGALNVPSLIIFGPTVKEFGFFPFRCKSIVIQKDIGCKPCSHIGSKSCPKKHFKCMEEITVQDVKDALEQIRI